MRKRLHLIASLALFLLALAVSPPSGEDVVAWDWAPAFLFLALLLIAKGIERQHLYDAASRNLPYFRKTWFLLLTLVLLAFLSGALLTGFLAVCFLAPVASKVLKDKERTRLVPGTLALLALSALSGSLLLPTGSPANLILSFHGVSVILTLWPFSLCGLAAAVAAIPAVLGGKVSDTLYLPPAEAVPVLGNTALKMLYPILALTVTLSAAGMIFWLNELALVVVIVAIFDRDVLRKTDYSLPVSMLLLSIAGYAFGLGTGSFVLQAGLTEILTSTLSVPLLIAGTENAASLARAASIASLPLATSLPALAALRSAEDKKAFLKCYTPMALAAFIVMCVLACFL